jgi:hypothetical protein
MYTKTIEKYCSVREMRIAEEGRKRVIRALSTDRGEIM